MKYRMIAHSVGAPVDVVGGTAFLEHRGDYDCSRGNCAVLRGVLCQGLPMYWFADAQCAQLMASHAGAPLVEADVLAGSFVDCSVYRGALRRDRCLPRHRTYRLGLYRVAG